MNAAYVALGAVFMALGGAQMARARNSDDPPFIRAKRMSGAFFIMAGVAFIGIGIIMKARDV